MTTDTTVSRITARSRFEIRSADGRLAGIAEYVASPGVVEFTHTVVRDDFEGQGIGGILARAALDQVRADGDRVIATCPFIAGWIDRHPDYADLLASPAD